RKGNRDGPRPGRNLVDVEPEPVGKQDDFWRDGGDGIVVVLPEKTEIDLGKCIDLGDAAQFENLFAGALQCRMVGGVTGQFQTKIGLDRGADVGRTVEGDAPSRVLILVLENPVYRLLEALLIAGTQQCVQQDVVRFQGGIGFELAAPVAFLVLLREKIFAGGCNGGTYSRGEVFNFAEAKLRGGAYMRFGGVCVHLYSSVNPQSR